MLSLDSFISQKKQELLDNSVICLNCLVKANSKKNKIIELLLDNQTLKIAINALPLEGRANNELISFLSKEFKTAKSLITIKKGRSSKIKLIMIRC
jgi:uncharacterized protein